ncbi:MAG: Uma2 family endonuclease [Gemmatimonadales bacterium]|nr:Uma2 family endonuclease [Gemmatimonadales bacterium]
MPQTAQNWTVERVLALPEDGNRYEVVDGALLVTPSPSFHHQDAILALARRLDPLVRSSGTAYLSIAPADIEFDKHTLVQPDLFVSELPGGRRPERWTDITRILLAVEVLSPSTAPADRHVKRRLYQRHGVPEYWIVDLDARLVERWRPGEERPEILCETLSWQVSGSHAPFELDLPGFFAEVRD